MPSHELASIIGIIAIWTTLGAFFAGYYFAKRRSKKYVDKLAKSHSTNLSNNDENAMISKDSRPEPKKFDWL
jgi:hypothetical protein